MINTTHGVITDPVVIARVEDYISALETNYRGSRYATNARGYTLTIGSGKYHRITSDGSVHAFVDAQGNIYKPAGWKAPVKTPLYNVLNDDSFKALLVDADWAGGHLYKGKQSFKLTQEA